MKRSQLLDQISPDAGGVVYGDPYQTPDGTTIITAARVQTEGADGSTLTATPLGVMVVGDGRAKWVPAVDANRIALVGVLTGLLAAVITSLAVLRRPPWPDLRRAIAPGERAS